MRKGSLKWVSLAVLPFLLMSVFLPLTYAQGTEVFFDPSKIIKDYTLQPVGSNFVLKVNVTNAIDLYNGQVRVLYNTTMFNVVGVASGGFIHGPDGTNFNFRVNEASGWVLASESIIGWWPGIFGNGTLFVFTFQVTSYGKSDFTFDLAYTFLQDSTLNDMPFTATNGYFRNALLGDATMDKIVNVFDVLKVKYHRSGPPPGPGGYLREADINDDGIINVFDILIVKANLGRTAP